MSGLSFHLQGKWAALQVEKGGDFCCSGGHRRRKGEILEPNSVLDQRRSPSPSTSTLSSSLGGSTDTPGAGVAAISENNTIKWPTAAAGAAEAEGREKEWASELHPIPPAFEVGGEKRGMGVDDWDIMFSEAAAVSQGQEQTFLHWIMGDVEDPSAITKQHQQHHSMMEFDTGSASLIDHGFAFEPIAGFGAGGGPPILAPDSSASLASLGSSSAQPVQLAPPPQFAAAPGAKNPIFVPQAIGMTSLTLPLPPAMLLQEPAEEKSQLFAPNLLISRHQQSQLASSPNSAFFLPSPELHQNPSLLPPHPELFLRLNHSHSQPNQSSTFSQIQTIPYQLQQRPMKPKSSATGDEAAVEDMTIQQQQQALVNQLFKAAELVEAGNFVGAHGILARLNHQLPSPIGKPLLRSVFYFKEALQLLANSANPQGAASSSPFHHHRSLFTTPLATPLDVVLKLGAYKAFSEVSPILQFTNFTATQALLEELGSEDCIHIIDFDIGVGGQWSSFMQELVQRRLPAVPLLKITAFVTPSTFHPLELPLARDNLSHFAADLNIPFEINIASIEAFDPAEILVLSAGSNEAIIVNLPVGAWQGPSFPTLLRLVKQLLPKIVISVDHGCDGGELSFSHHFLRAFQSCMVLLDSIDAAGTNLDVANKIERFVLQPRIENSVIGRHRAADKMLPWRTLFASTGFVPVQFSNFTEMQAECLLKRVQVRGFHVEKHQASLYLYWQRGELASVSAWRC